VTTPLLVVLGGVIVPFAARFVLPFGLAYLSLMAGSLMAASLMAALDTNELRLGEPSPLNAVTGALI